MNKIRGTTTAVGIAALMVTALACGSGAEPASPNDEAPTLAPLTAGGATPTDSNPPSTTKIRPALEAPEGSDVTVSGFFFADKDGNARLCSGLLESSPPQCGGDRIDLLGFDGSSVPNSKTPQRPSEIETARWTDSYITVTGIKGIGGLVEVRLSTEAPTTQRAPSAPAPGIQPAPPVMGMMAPNLRLTFDGVEYTGVEILGAASPNGPIVCCGTPIDMDDMEVVGTGAQHNPDDDATLQVYRPKTNGTTDVYTFHPEQTRSKVDGAPPEDEADTTPATWTRWTAN